MLDLRLALRSLSRTPALTATAVCAIGAGIGANTALFSVVRAVLLQPLPYAEPDRVVRVHNHWEGSPEARLSPAEYFDYLDGSGDALTGFGAYAYGAVNLAGHGTPERAPAAAVTPGALPAFGVAPAAGRLFTADDAAGPAVALISHSCWQRRFGGAADVVGRTLAVDGRATEVVGVLPARFRLPEAFGADGGVDVYLPLDIDRTEVTERGSHFLLGVGRLAPGVTRERAEAVLAAVAARFVEAYPDDYPSDMRFGVDLVPMREAVVGNVRPVLGLLLAAVGLVLLAACANVAGLLLARTEDRRRELAVRQALGASRARIVAQLLGESLVLSALGGASGLGLAAWGVALLEWLRPPDLPRLAAVQLDGSVLAFAAAISLVTGLVAGIAPALWAGASPAEDLHAGGRSVTTGGRAHALRWSFVTSQVALAVVLVVGAGLLLRTIDGLLRVDPGYRSEGVLTTRLSLPDLAYPSDESRRRFFAELVGGVAGLPGVASAGAATRLPLDGRLGDINLEIEGREVRDGEVSPALDWQAVTPGYLATMGIPVRRGRGIEPQDTEEAPGVVVLTEAAARRVFPGEEPLGKRFRLGGGAGPGRVTVVGVVGDVRHESLGALPRPGMYLAHRQFRFWHGGSAPSTLSLVVRAHGDPAALAGAVGREVSRLDPALPTGAFRTLEAITRDSVARPRFVLRLLGGFAALALLLASLGTYGMVAQAVARRRREMGVRLALGARPSQIFGLVLRQGMGTVVAGVALGSVAAVWLTRSLQGLLYGVEPGDPSTLAATGAVLAAAGALACALPAHRATRVDPAVVLRLE